MQEIEILFEDENIMAIDKPAGMLAYPLPGSDEKTVGDIVGAKPCHRLDRDTSGVLLLAKNDKALIEMQKLFKDRKIEKRYKALVWGKVEPEKGEINIPLGRGAKDRLRVVPKGSGRESRTVYVVEKYFSNTDSYSARPRSVANNKKSEVGMSLVDIDLKTGRTHQIRVHFSAIGHPVVGDPKYSNRKTGLGRQFLHAYSVSFVNPFDSKKTIVSSPLTKDLSDFLNHLA